MKRSLLDYMVDIMVDQFDQPILKKRRLQYEGSLVWALVRKQLVEENDAQLREHRSKFNLNRERQLLEQDRESIQTQEIVFGAEFYDSSYDWEYWVNDLTTYQRRLDERMKLLEEQTTCRLVQKNLIHQ